MSSGLWLAFLLSVLAVGAVFVSTLRARSAAAFRRASSSRAALAGDDVVELLVGVGDAGEDDEDPSEDGGAVSGTRLFPFFCLNNAARSFASTSLAARAALMASAILGHTTLSNKDLFPGVGFERLDSFNISRQRSELISNVRLMLPDASAKSSILRNSSSRPISCLQKKTRADRREIRHGGPAGRAPNGRRWRKVIGITRKKGS